MRKSLPTFLKQPGHWSSQETIHYLCQKQTKSFLSSKLFVLPSLSTFYWTKRDELIRLRGWNGSKSPFCVPSPATLSDRFYFSLASLFLLDYKTPRRISDLLEMFFSQLAEVSVTILLFSLHGSLHSCDGDELFWHRSLIAVASVSDSELFRVLLGKLEVKQESQQSSSKGDLLSTGKFQLLTLSKNTELLFYFIFW